MIIHDGVIDGAHGRTQSPRIRPDGRTFAYDAAPRAMAAHPLSITQNDVRAIQLAKAALYAGVRLLMERLQAPSASTGSGWPAPSARHIDVKYAMVLGMIPDCAARCRSVLRGQRRGHRRADCAPRTSAARSRGRRSSCGAVEKIETAIEPRFQHHFVGAMGVPHTSDAFPELGREVVLPAPRTLERDTARRRRRG